MVYLTSYTIKQMANILGVHPDTLRNWERDKLLIPHRVNKRGDRRYTDEHIRQVQEKKLIPNPQIKALKRTEEYDTYTKEQLINELENLKKIKRFGLVWEESEKEKVIDRCKREAPILAHQAAKRILTDKNKPNNVFIEGDNYHALQVLNYTHRGKIDVIYIDPPYNTGKKEWFYNDKYVDNEDRFRHSKWLNMMKKRLALTVNLLSESGVIFISIDDNEQAHLKLLCDYIFGEENFIACLPTVMNLKGNNDQFGFAGAHEYTLVYMKDKTKGVIRKFNINEEDVYAEWQEDEKGLFKQGANLKATGINAPREKRQNLFFPVYVDKNGIISLEEKKRFFELLPITDGKEMSWRWSKEKFLADINDIIVKKVGNQFTLYKKQRPQLGDLPSRKPKTIFYRPEYSSGNGTTQIKNLFGEKVFNNPKPLELIKDLIFIGGHKKAVILDFFAGSGTTGHAVLELNKEDGGARKFILCTNNENYNGNGNGGIAESVCYPRIKKVIKGYKKEGKKEHVACLGGNLEYFETDFVDVENIQYVTDDKKLKFTYEAGWILAFKEDCFEEIERNKYYQIFTDGAGKYVAVYFRENVRKLDELDKKMLGKSDVKMYIFTYDGGGFNWIKRYVGYENVRVKDIPEPILKIYREVNL